MGNAVLGQIIFTEETLPGGGHYRYYENDEISTTSHMYISLLPY